MFWNPQPTMSANGYEAETGTKICPYCAEEIQAEAIKCKHCLSWIGGQWQRFAGPGAAGRSKPGVGLRRTTDDRKVFGVCGGLARATGIDPTILRVVYALATVFTAIVPGTVAYLVMTWAIPNEDQYA